MEKMISLIGLGVVGAPLANSLFRKYKSDFSLLSSEEFVGTLTDSDLYMNGELFNPNIISRKDQLHKGIGVVFVCVKNYHVENAIRFLHQVIDEKTVIVPLQNGVYSYERFSREFPRNVVLEGFAQGPNTQIFGGCSFIYQKPGMFHLGSSTEENKQVAKDVCRIMNDAGVVVYYNDDIRYQTWKKLMLNVAGNALTALTGIDYCLLEKSKESKHVLTEAMEEFIEVAKTKNITLSKQDIDDIFNYYYSFKVPKKTSMLEDVTNNRPTENKYLAGYICELARRENIQTPYIDCLYNLIKIKEDVYLKRIN